MLIICVVPAVEDVSWETQCSKKKGLSLSWLMHGPDLEICRLFIITYLVHWVSDLMNKLEDSKAAAIRVWHRSIDLQMQFEKNCFKCGHGEVVWEEKQLTICGEEEMLSEE